MSKRKKVERTAISLDSMCGSPRDGSDVEPCAEEEPLKPFTLVKAPGINKGKLVSADENKDSRTCQGCIYRFAPPVLGKQKTGIDDVYAIYAQNRYIDEDHLADLISQAFEEKVLLPGLLNGSSANTSPWLPSSIKHHLKHHQHDAEYAVINDIRDCKVLEDGLKKYISDQDPSDMPDVVAISSLLSVKKLKLSLYQKM
jgi:hypothetical protein